MIVIIAIIAMSDKSDSEDSTDDGVEELFDAARISEKDLAKLATHEVTDCRSETVLQKCLLCDNPPKKQYKV